RARSKETRRSFRCILCNLFERCDVVEDVKTTPVGGDDQVVKFFLNDGPRNWSVRQSGLQRSPMTTIVGGVVESVARAGEEQTLAIGISDDHTNIRQLMFGQPAADRLPCLPEVGGLIDVGIAVVHQMEINRDVSCSRIEHGWLNTGDRAPRR